MKKKHVSAKAKTNALDAWMKQSNACNMLGQILRGPKKEKLTASMRILEAVRDLKAPEGPMMRVVLITEGLGNRVNMNYYGPECLESAPRIFEGKSCYLNHPGEIESRDIPERRVQDKCGYFKNVRVEFMEGQKCVTGELHFDLSESGRNGYAKALTALHYKDEFPGANDEYVGLSINADGEVEDRRVTWMGEVLDVNYVKQFTEAFSCDIVTTPARGGRFLALVESAAGAKKINKEAGTMNKQLEESLKAAQSALEEADKETDAGAKATKLAEANKLFKAFLAEAHKEAAVEESDEQKKAREAQEAMDKKAKEKKESADDGDDDEAKAEKKDAKESKRLAVKALATEANVELPDEKLDQLAVLPLSEAKTEISILKKMVESVAKKVVNRVAAPTVNYAKMTEAERKEAGVLNNDIFSDLVR